MKIGNLTLDAKKPVLMGIINVTPDSFSDGGNFLSHDSAIEHALKLEADGADILDIGGESTRPGANSVSQEEEIERVIPVIEGIRKQSNIPISIDTTKALVAKAAINAGADMINDVSAGKFDDGIFSVAAKSGKPICLMHMQGEPRTMQENPQYDDLIADIHECLEDSVKEATKAGIGRDKIILDPGIGFGKTAEGNLEILKHLSRFGDLNCHLLIGASRKSFIGKILGLDVQDRLEATLATIPASIEGGASIIRLHDISQARKFLEMYLLLK